MLPSLADYERLVYTLPDRHPMIRRSTLIIIRHGPAFAELTGTLEFDDEIRLTVWEDLNFARGVIQGYSYAVSRGEERLYWYDPQPHPNDPSLASTQIVPEKYSSHPLPEIPREIDDYGANQPNIYFSGTASSPS